MRRSSVHAVRMVLGLLAVSLSLLGAMRANDGGGDGAGEHARTVQTRTVSHG